MANRIPRRPLSHAVKFSNAHIQRCEQVDQVGDSRDLQRPTGRRPVGDDGESGLGAVGLVVRLHQHLHARPTPESPPGSGRRSILRDSCSTPTGRRPSVEGLSACRVHRTRLPPRHGPPSFGTKLSVQPLTSCYGDRHAVTADLARLQSEPGQQSSDQFHRCTGGADWSGQQGIGHAGQILEGRLVQVRDPTS